jgi:Tol biopolymer transport system component
VWIVQPSGASRALLPGVTRPEGWPRLSPDGTWVYFVRDYKSLWRAHLDGTGLDSLTSFTAPRVYATPTISPDGRSVAIEDGTGLQVIDVATKASTKLSVPCAFPQYSPDGAFFACATLSDVSIMRTDGTGSRMVASLMTTGALDELSGVDWTPDGKWLLVMIGYRFPALVEVSSGAVLPLTGIGAAYFQPSFVR